MKLTIINPNSSKGMTEAIDACAKACVAGRYEVNTLRNATAPDFIDGYEDSSLCVPGMIQLVREHQADSDAFIIACHCDPGIDALKEISQKPVVGIGEASMKLATFLGHKFSVLTTSSHSISTKEAVINGYHLLDYMASVAAPTKDDPAEDELTEAFLDAARLAVERDRAEVLVLGCAGLTGLDELITEKLHVPVLDGIKCALAVAEGLVNMGLNVSRAGRYHGKNL